MTNLKMYRQLKGLTQFDVEKQLNISTCSLSLFENGHRLPKEKLLNDLAELYGVSVDDLKGNFTMESGAVA